MGDGEGAGRQLARARRGMSASFWDGVAELDRIAAKAKAEALRAEREADVIARHGVAKATTRICCRLRWSADVCEPNACVVLDATLG